MNGFFCNIIVVFINLIIFEKFKLFFKYVILIFIDVIFFFWFIGGWVGVFWMRIGWVVGCLVVI